MDNEINNDLLFILSGNSKEAREFREKKQKERVASMKRGAASSLSYRILRFIETEAFDNDQFDIHNLRVRVRIAGPTPMTLENGQTLMRLTTHSNGGRNCCTTIDDEYKENSCELAKLALDSVIEKLGIRTRFPSKRKLCWITKETVKCDDQCDCTFAQFGFMFEEDSSKDT